VETVGLRTAVKHAVADCGVALLRDPHRFVGNVTDLIDTETPVARVLYVGCDERYLAIFADAYEVGSAGALEGASTSAAAYLCDEYILNPNMSRATSWSIAAGCADALGLTLSMGGAKEPQPVAAAYVPQQPAQPATRAASTRPSVVQSGSSYPAASVRPVGQRGRSVARPPRPAGNNVSEAARAVAVANRQAALLAQRPRKGASTSTAAKTHSTTKLASVASKQARLLAHRPSAATKSIIEANKKSNRGK
jgi:hypothetical protein